MRPQICGAVAVICRIHLQSGVYLCCRVSLIELSWWMLSSNAELARKLNALEKKYDAQFRVVFNLIREHLCPLETKKRKIRFRRGPTTDC